MLFNPLGTDGFEFVEYTAANPQGIEQLKLLFTQLGFAQVAKHKSKQVWLFKQGDINFIVNAEADCQAAEFASSHGASVCSLAFRVENARLALDYAINHGAKPFTSRVAAMELNIPAIYGIGDSTLYLVDRYGEQDIYHIDFEFYPDWQSKVLQQDVGLTQVDHLTHNVYRGHMDQWADFYQRIGNFQQIRYFDIEGQLTGLVSRAMTSPCGKIRIPINEATDEQSQIEEFLTAYHGEGIQHIALSTRDIYQTVEKLKVNGIQFMHTPAIYYQNLAERIGQHNEDMGRLQREQILMDGSLGKEGLLLQIFTNTVIGPVFFEIIQRKGNQGFGEGNFQALFESIEQEQIRRGVLTDKASQSH
ncbi:4-hydroxyphenylpyruvate dioxygenase [Saccharobesus litoralis]|uniref:4-hydroxyphenylpyruvate dioxygenase n=1 Tax=Saccharobesus litoralis TaxID=2172099 RepID=A0A2S0VNZ6_9ALTE|nr:4-hydroxyphenylpyruvate dioxygenase [Saccharobesus litoralis]AWB65929.1 4-hydroxyphenylpyruvate dioxygenase [Saccharobesus litoralis]